MRILLNFSTLKKGGGQNVGLNFLHALFDQDNNTINAHQYYFLIVKNSDIHKYLLNKKCENILTTSASPLTRIFHELFSLSMHIKKLKIDIIYTYFGFGLFTINIPQVCGVAVSNLFFPEIKFWHGNLLKITIRKLVDRYRIYGIKKATGLIFENQAMEQRCHSLFHIQKNKTTFIPPSFNPSFEQEKLDLPELKKNTTKLLMLCGWQLNKNIMRVPEIAANLKKSNHAFQFIITAPNDNSKNHLRFLLLTKKYKVGDMISIIGPVKKQYLESLYSQIDIVLLMSKLESFSNNIIEAWYFKKPLVTTNAEWAKGICKDAALYVDRDSSQIISKAIINLYELPNFQKELINNGLNELRSYPSIEEKTKKEIEFLQKIYNEF